MDNTDIMNILKNYKKEVSGQYNIISIGVFGSVARNTPGEESDIPL